MDERSTRVILASASPRRRILLGLLGIPFTTHSSDAEDAHDPIPSHIRSHIPACDLRELDHPVVRAWRKASDVWMQDDADIVLAADTEVVLDGTILGKPHDAAHARSMLRRLSGRTHGVYSGLCVYSCLSPIARKSSHCSHIPPTSIVHSHDTTAIQQCWDAEACCHIWFDLVISRVTFGILSDSQIDEYVTSGEPLDKAGAYAIQGRGGTFITHLEGSYTNVIGLPLPSSWHLLVAAGLSLSDPSAAYETWLNACRTESHLWHPLQV